MGIGSTVVNRMSSALHPWRDGEAVAFVGRAAATGAEELAASGGLLKAL